MKTKSLLLSLILMLSISSYGQSGRWNNVTWNITDSVLTISGVGAMDSYMANMWYIYRTLIKDVIIEEGITTIGNYAFSICTNLKTITIPNSVTSIGELAFRECTSLTSIEIPNSVTSIGNSAFFYCKSLTSIEIPNGVTNIGNSTFDTCSSLTSIIIPNSVTSIGERAFNSCRSLTSIIIPNSVTSIGNQAFNYCTSLTSINISNSVISIGNQAFDNINLQATVEVMWENPPAFSSPRMFGSNSTKLTLVVPSGTRVLYQSTNPWRSFGTIVERTDNVPVTSVSISPISATLVVGNSLQLVATFSPFDATDKSLTWASNNEAVATVDSSGKVTALASGSATITVTTNDGNKTATFNVTVFEVDVISVELDNKKSVLVGGTLQLTATFNPSYSSNKNVTWSSSNNAVATVDETGKVSGISEGRATITVTTNNGKTATCMVAVTVSKLINFATIEIPFAEIGESIIFDIERYEGDRKTSSFVLGLLEGMIIDPGSIIFTESLSEGLEFIATPLGNNIWLFEINPTLAPYSLLLSTENPEQTTSITYRLTGGLFDIYEIVLHSDMGLHDGAIPKYELTLKSVVTANSQIKNNVKVYITNGILTVDSPDNETIRIYSTTGTLAFADRKNAGICNFYLSNLSSGTYFVTGSKGWSEKIFKK